MANISHLIKTYSLLLKVATVAVYSEMRFGIRNLRGTFRLLRRAAAASHYPPILTNEPRERLVCFVLGNGPSLATDIKENLDIFRKGDTFCVNSFAESDLYEKIQPKYYVLADPGYWSSAVPESFVPERNRLFNQILSKTNWPLTIYLPFEAKEAFDGMFSRAKNIRVKFYNAVPLAGGRPLVKILYDNDLSMPAPQNVLIPALFLSLRLGYKKVIVLGADHSWHETLALDEANRVCIRQPHFYDPDAKLTPFSMGVEGRHGESLFFTMDTALYAFAKTFEGYWKLEEYAKYLGAQVYNASSVTYIDAFKRISISDLLIELSGNARKDN